MTHFTTTQPRRRSRSDEPRRRTVTSDSPAAQRRGRRGRRLRPPAAACRAWLRITRTPLAPRKAAPRATAAPARWSSGNRPVRPDGVRLAALNACIQFLPALDGKAVFTVEGIRATDGGLHPAQQAMIDSHGSQCGFCTPGFVMSFAGRTTRTRPHRRTAPAT
ncbi:2Fe-2S iron-sulfur cluster-binding protein [Thauera humireducens]|uniref:2Fe-2S iron-sulfur cluster-binding protein n=1 Tax=Thauera humireducens TaxID=1134435 RepID=UPI00311EE45F